MPPRSHSPVWRASVHSSVCRASSNRLGGGGSAGQSRFSQVAQRPCGTWGLAVSMPEITPWEAPGA